MKSDFMCLNVVLKLPDPQAEKIICFSKEIAQGNHTHFVFDGENYHPHITLYSPEYPAKNFDEVMKTVESVSKNYTPIFCRVLGFAGSQGYIGLKIDMTNEVRKLHEELVTKLNPLREGHVREKYLADYQMNFSEEKKENIKKYGYPNSMSLYHPHLTVVCLQDEEKAAEIQKKLKPPVGDFIVSKLGVYKMGSHGTCKKLIMAFDLAAGKVV